MRNSIMTLLFLASFQLYGQVNSGTVQYSVTFDEKDMKDFGLYQDAVNSSNQLNYILDFSKSESNFYLKPGIDNSPEFKMAKAFAGISSLIYQNLRDSTYQYNSSESPYIKPLEFLIIESIQTNWTLHDETKEIGGYTCFKATTFYTVNDKKFPIVAWYCPKIPLGFGPSGYGNLPGLILEIQIRYILFGATHIAFKNDVNIKKPNMGKVVCKAEYQKIIRERSEKFYGEKLEQLKSKQ